ncbi:LysR substrate-binding domain-containing protein [Arenimonas sp.]|uniref:LysR substrate-binding domain-containing protein n=1 Tax=Arenimonas sp. TaxID=1872635 RepID=UPI002E2F9512|nr:LysR substrate-binding domain-containing protein [Arenimonas sp.]HEX4853702.1 LysR substrate-binding domain-containing protein [Arenimonas sp.]
MPNTPRPSFNALRAFEATARLRSMTAAADELAVTHGAVSRHVRSLEEQLGVQLLTRGPHATEPTPEGARLAEGVAAALNLMHAALEQLKPGPLTLSCSASILTHWLIPRLARFHQQHPGVELQFNVNYGPVDVVRENIGVAIRNTMVQPPEDVVVRELVTEWVGPVCSPDYMRGARIRQPADLAEARLLATKTRPNAWAEWAAAAAVGGMEFPVRERFEHFYVLIQAAVCGLGIAPVPRMLVLDDLQSGKLVAPFGFAPGPHKLALWIAPHMRTRPETQALAQWLTEELQETADRADAAR